MDTEHRRRLETLDKAGNQAEEDGLILPSSFYRG